MTSTVHPVADEATDEYLVYESNARLVQLSEPVRVLLQIATTDRLRPVLVTDVHARLSPVVHVALAQAGGYWAVHGGGRLHDTRTGHQLTGFTDLWAPPPGPRPVLDRFAGPPNPGTAVLGFDAYTHASAEPGTLVGVVADTTVTALGGHTLTRWGTAEPFLTRHDPAQLTAYARAHMPRTPPIWAGAPDGSFTQTTIGRARHGLVEHTTGGVPVGPWPTPTALVARAAQALTVLAGQATVTLALVWATGREPDATVTAVPRAPDQPLAVLIGARTVHDLDVDLVDLGSRHQVDVLGRARTPSALVTFTDPDADLWTQLLGLAADLGPARIAHAAGWETPHAR